MFKLVLKIIGIIMLMIFLFFVLLFEVAFIEQSLYDYKQSIVNDTVNCMKNPDCGGVK